MRRSRKRGARHATYRLDRSPRIDREIGAHLPPPSSARANRGWCRGCSRQARAAGMSLSERPFVPSTSEMKARFPGSSSGGRAAFSWKRPATLAVHRVVSSALVAQRALVRRVERQKFAANFGTRAVPHDLGHRVNLEIERAIAIGNDVIFVHPLGEVDAVCLAREQVDGGGAEERNERRADRALEHRMVPVDQQHHLELAPGAGLDPVFEPRSSIERKRAGKAKYSCSRR